MLVLSRKIGESIRIGEDGRIAVTVVQVSGNMVRLGIEAPREVPIVREELLTDPPHDTPAPPPRVTLPRMQPQGPR